jgi:hypothetical protein
LKGQGLEKRFKPLLLYVKGIEFSKIYFLFDGFSSLYEQKRFKNHCAPLCAFFFAPVAVKNFLTRKGFAKERKDSFFSL